MEVSSESDSEIDEEDQKRIDEEMHKRQQKKNMRTSVSAEVYGIHNVKKPFLSRVIQKTKDQI